MLSVVIAWAVILLFGSRWGERIGWWCANYQLGQLRRRDAQARIDAADAARRWRARYPPRPPRSAPDSGYLSGGPIMHYYDIQQQRTAILHHDGMIYVYSAPGLPGVDYREWNAAALRYAEVMAWLDRQQRMLATIQQWLCPVCQHGNHGCEPCICRCPALWADLHP